MDLWSILVLGTLRLNCNWDYDKLLEIANHHKTVREFLGHTIYEFGEQYALQPLKDNIFLFAKAKQEERIVQPHLQYVDSVGSYVERAKFCIGFLKQTGMGNVGQTTCSRGVGDQCIGKPWSEPLPRPWPPRI